MTSHQLARRLLALPNLNIAIARSPQPNQNIPEEHSVIHPITEITLVLTYQFESQLVSPKYDWAELEPSEQIKPRRHLIVF